MWLWSNWHVLEAISDYSINLLYVGGTCPCQAATAKLVERLVAKAALNMMPICITAESSPLAKVVPVVGVPHCHCGWQPVIEHNWNVIEQVRKSRIFLKAIKVMRECSRHNLQYSTRCWTPKVWAVQTVVFLSLAAHACTVSVQPENNLTNYTRVCRDPCVTLRAQIISNICTEI